VTELVNLAEATVVKAGNGFCVTLRDGGLPIESDHPLGLYLDDCRHLRGHELRLGARAPRPLIASDSPGTAAAFELTNPELELASGQVVPPEMLRVRLERQMLPGEMLERITLESYFQGRIELPLELRLDADFRPMLEVRGMVPASERRVDRSATGDSLRFAAMGLDGRERSTLVTCTEASAGDEGRLSIPVTLEPGQQRTFDIRFTLEARDGDGRATHASMAAADAEVRAWLAERPRVELDNELVNRAVARSLLDLRLLTSKLDGHSYYAAGVPWYATLFGRDSIVSAIQTLAFDATVGEDTLRLLAGRIGRRKDDEHDEEPGKILHELRLGELADRDETPLTRYYGTVDATPLFLCLLCEHADWSGSLELFRELRPEVEAALGWIDDYGDLDGDGLIEYRRRSSGGLENQGWKDSWNGIVDEQGVPLRAPIALVEAQGYVVACKRRLARLYELDGEPSRAESLRDGAAALAEALERFWLPDRGFYSMALDADKRPSRALASNQGHLLWALAVPPERAAAIRHALTEGSAYSGWGVRTLGADEPGFNAVGYHAGTIWPHDTAFFAVGLRKYGFDDAFLRIFRDLLDAAASFPAYRLPELFAGFPRAPHEGPVPDPVACSPQAWAAGALPWMLVSGLGLIPDGLARTLRIRRPLLPRHVGRLALKGLRVADARVDLVFERVRDRADRIALTDARVDGDLDVVLDAAHSHPWERATRGADGRGGARRSTSYSSGT
jgi:glycogen debranching enzyme